MKYRIKPDAYTPTLMVETQHVGHHNWSIAAGPFTSKEAARKWIDEDIARLKEMEEFRNANPIEYYP